MSFEFTPPDCSRRPSARAGRLDIATPTKVWSDLSAHPDYRGNTSSLWLCERTLQFACLGHQRKTLTRDGCFHSCVLRRKLKLSSGTRSFVPPFQTPRDVSKTKEEQSFEIRFKNLHSKQDLDGITPASHRKKIKTSA